MRILINYDKHLENYKGVIAGVCKTKNLIPIGTHRVLEIGELLEAAKQAHADGILIANEGSLKNCVESKHKVTLDKYRGSRLNFSIPMIVGAPLDHLRKVRHGRWLYERDLEKFQHVKTPVTQLAYTLCDTADKLVAALDKAATALIIANDVETERYSRITCVSYACLLPSLKIYSFLIPFIAFDVDVWQNEMDYAFAIETMRRTNALPAAKLMWNGMYDASYYIKYGAEPRNWTLDGMGLAHSQYSELPKTLDFVASIYLYDYYFWKDEATEAGNTQDIGRYYSYCVRDSWNTLRVFLAQMQQLPSYALKNYQMLFKMVYPYLYCGFEGSLLDMKAMEDNRKTAQAIADSALRDLKTMAADQSFNPASPKQVGTLLFDILGAKPVKNKRTTKEQALNQIAEQHPILQVFISSLLEYREKAKAVSTYFGFATLNDRVLYNIDPFGTDTGRAASRKSNFRLVDIDGKVDSYGAQVQNIPEYAKNMIIPDPGYVLSEADNNKSEARCVGYLSQCLALMACLADPKKDFYKTLGTIFFGIPYEEVTKELRNKVLKKIVHGRNYLMGANTFVDTVGIKQLYEGAALLHMTIKSVVEFANFLLSQYNKPFPELNEWYVDIKMEILRTHKLTSPMGYTRYFFGDITKDHKVFRNAVAHAPQNLSVIIINQGVWRVYTEILLPSHGEFRLKAQIHDSIKSQYLASKADYYSKEVLRCMDNPVTVHGRVLSIPVDIKVSEKHWLDLKG